ncbi:MAG: hypothetical protein HY040_10095 [Planctomycetes bacterium]|nr:hypothetical protein [Planctomycetota bacterium]
MFNTVVRQAERVPDFWGRYLARFKLQKDEIDFLRKNSPQTRLLLIHNPVNLGFFQDRPRNPEEEHARGKWAALEAKAAADSLDKNIPHGVSIYVNVEQDSEPNHIGIISSDWILGWWEGMRASKYGFGGIYANVSRKSQANNVAFLGDAYTEALKSMPGPNPPLWGMFKHKGKKIPEHYDPEEPPGASGAVVVWQYFASLVKGDFDRDLATKRAYDRMWKLDPLPGAHKEKEHMHAKQNQEGLAADHRVAAKKKDKERVEATAD